METSHYGSGSISRYRLNFIPPVRIEEGNREAWDNGFTVVSNKSLIDLQVQVAISAWDGFSHAFVRRTEEDLALASTLRSSRALTKELLYVIPENAEGIGQNGLDIRRFVQEWIESSDTPITIIGEDALLPYNLLCFGHEGEPDVPLGLKAPIDFRPKLADGRIPKKILDGTARNALIIASTSSSREEADIFQHHVGRLWESLKEFTDDVVPGGWNELKRHVGENPSPEQDFVVLIGHGKVESSQGKLVNTIQLSSHDYVNAIVLEGFRQNGGFVRRPAILNLVCYATGVSTGIEWTLTEGFLRMSAGTVLGSVCAIPISIASDTYDKWAWQYGREGSNACQALFEAKRAMKGNAKLLSATITCWYGHDCKL